MSTLARLFSCFLLVVCIGCSQDRESQISSLMQEYDAPGTPGAALAVIIKGEKVFHRGYGVANVEMPDTVGTSTNFRLASVTKQFTAMSIMMLVEREQLSYETSISEIFPEFPPYAETITIRNILQHTSGFLDYESQIPDSVTEQVHDDDVLRMMLTQVDSTYFEPGSAYQYSNSGYAVLAMAIEKISGMSFPEFLKANIFDPLGMTNTVAFVDGESTVSDRAYGHSFVSDEDNAEEGSWKVTDQSQTSAVLGDGGIYSSIDDLYLWDQALYTDRLVPQATLAEAFTPNLEVYGFGWRIDEYEGRVRYRHSGSTQGFRNYIMRLPQDSVTVILLTNRNSDAVRPLAEEVAELFLD